MYKTILHFLAQIIYRFLFSVSVVCYLVLVIPLIIIETIIRTSLLIPLLLSWIIIGKELFNPMKESTTEHFFYTENCLYNIAYYFTEIID